MGALSAAYLVQGVSTLLAAVVLAAWLRRKTRVGYGVLFAGAAAFIASQAAHYPLNWGLSQLPIWDGAPLVVLSILGGATAALCEEGARYVTIRFVRREVRDSESGLMLGAGHGGIECAILGGLALLGAYQVAIVSQSTPQALGLSPSELDQARAQISALSEDAWLVPILGTFERLFVLPFHLAASLLVTRSVRDARPSLLLAAIAFHMALDSPLLWLQTNHGVVATELWVAGVGVASLFVIAYLAPRMRRPRAARAAGVASGLPLELAHARKVYEGRVLALRDATLTLEAGTRTCLLGPNGAGKTTTIRLITGGIAPSAGDAWLFGKAMGDPDFVAAKRRLGVVPQQPGMYDDMRVRDWLELVRDLYERGDPESIASELGLSELMDRPMAKLSGGQKRRVAIAAALLGEPDLLLLDEPSAGLDPVASHEVISYLEKLAPTRTILLCTHDLEEAEALCDRVVVMRGGRVLVHESIANLRARLAPTLALRIAVADGEAEEDARTRLTTALIALGCEPRTDEDLSVRVTVGDARVDAPALLRALLAQDLDVVECVVVRASLEELFLDIVSQGASEERVSGEALIEEEPLPPPIQLAELVSPATRRLMRKEWLQLRSSGAALWTSLLTPFFFLGVIPQMLIALSRGAGAQGAGDVPDFGFIGEVGHDPSRLPVAVLPLFMTIAALTAPAALITHSILTEREKRTLELLAALPVRIHQVVAAKLACIGLFCSAICGALTLGIGIELLVFGLATPADVLGLLALLLATLAHGTSSSLWVALVARDFRTANNLAGVAIVPGIFVVLLGTALLPGGAARPLALALFFAVSSLLFARVALRGATFERLLS